VLAGIMIIVADADQDMLCAKGKGTERKIVQ